MRLLLLALVLCAACGNPDNVIYGSMNGENGSPAVVINPVRSAIHGLVHLTDPKTGSALGQATAIILSDHPDLCSVITANPNYFRQPSDAFVALVMTATADQAGTLYVNRDPYMKYTEALASNGGVPTQATFPVYDGYLSIGNLSYTGQASGSFDLILADTVSGQLHEFPGRFKTNACAGLGNAALP